ncbi:MAG: hypothetical protein AAGB11_12605 [Pseudomonadota bacterium]
MLRLSLALIFAAIAIPAYAAETEFPDWPCVQRKVISLTPAAVWTGPVFEGEMDWSNDDVVSDMVARLSQRRVPLEEAEAEIEAFAQSAGAEGADRLTMLFAGLFATMDAERSDIIAGIERYGRRQKELAQSVRALSAEVDRLRTASDPDLAALERAETDLLWQTRIFNERRTTLAYVCEVPRFVEKRLFTLGRSITKSMKQ